MTINYDVFGENSFFYCPQSFSGGGLYSKQNGLLFWSVIGDCDYGVCGYCNAFYQARALRALGLLLADGTPTVGGGKTF